MSIFAEPYRSDKLEFDLLYYVRLLNRSTDTTLRILIRFVVAVIITLLYYYAIVMLLSYTVVFRRWNPSCGSEGFL